ncbi:MAG: hypothetical protein R3A48_10315 [Polyangiales bacterium]
MRHGQLTPPRHAAALALLAALGCRRTPSRPAPSTPPPVALDASPGPRDASVPVSLDAAAPRDARAPGVLGRDELAPLLGPQEPAPVGPVTLLAAGEDVVAAWSDGVGVWARRRRGGRWAPMGRRVSDREPRGPIRLAQAPDGTPVIVWSERGREGPTETRFSRWNGGEWAALLGPLNAPAAGAEVTAITVAWSYGSPVVAMAVSRERPRQTELRAVRWTGVRWELAGPPSLLAPGAGLLALEAASCGDGSAVLGWVEVQPSGVPVLELRRWSVQTRTWQVLPRGALPLVDAETRTLALAGASGSEFFVTYAWSGGTHPVHRWSEGAQEWLEVGSPLPAGGRAGLEVGPLLEAQGEDLWMSWRARGGRLSAARLRRSTWEQVTDALDAPGGSDPRVAASAAGTIYASSRGAGGAVSLVSFGVE